MKIFESEAKYKSWLIKSYFRGVYSCIPFENKITPGFPDLMLLPLDTALKPMFIEVKYVQDTYEKAARRRIQFRPLQLSYLRQLDDNANLIGAIAIGYHDTGFLVRPDSFVLEHNIIEILY